MFSDERNVINQQHILNTHAVKPVITNMSLAIWCENGSQKCKQTGDFISSSQLWGISIYFSVCYYIPLQLHKMYYIIMYISFALLVKLVEKNTGCQNLDTWLGLLFNFYKFSNFEIIVNM